jgi:hypothetical protein
MTDHEAMLMNYQSPVIYWMLGCMVLLILFLIRKDIKVYLREFKERYL